MKTGRVSFLYHWTSVGFGVFLAPCFFQARLHDVGYIVSPAHERSNINLSLRPGAKMLAWSIQGQPLGVSKPVGFCHYLARKLHDWK